VANRAYDRPMLRRVAAFTVVAVAFAAEAGASGRVVPKHYTFSFSVAAKPDYTEHFPAAKVTGSGSGSFSIGPRQVDPRDGSIFYNLTGAKGSMSFSLGGKVIVKATVVSLKPTLAGVRFSTDTGYGGLTRLVAFNLHITSTTRFHCAAPDAYLGIQDLPQVKGDVDGLQFNACGSSLQWSDKSPALVVHVTPG
jgi:hypothetical protein